MLNRTLAAQWQRIIKLDSTYYLEQIVAWNTEILDGSADLDWDGIDIGKCIQGEVQDIKEYGVIVNIQDHKDVVGFVTHHQCKL